jgi:hypothetical protein
MTMRLRLSATRAPPIAAPTVTVTTRPACGPSSGVVITPVLSARPRRAVSTAMPAPAPNIAASSARGSGSSRSR